MSFTKLDYCQYLLSSQINYTLTNMADHLQKWSHDTINRYLKGEKLTPRLLFEQVEPLSEADPEAYLIFDDTVLDKSFGPKEDRGSAQAVERQRKGRHPRHRGGFVRIRQPQDRGLLGDRLPDLRPGQRWQDEARSRRGDVEERRASAGAFPEGADG